MKRSTGAVLLGIIFVLAGINHFISPSFYMKIMPYYLPEHELLIVVSGIAEIICGFLLMIIKTRRIGGWLSILLLIAMFPANVQMAINESDNRSLLFYVAFIRLPLQIVLICWVFWVSNPLKARS